MNIETIAEAIWRADYGGEPQFNRRDFSVLHPDHQEDYRWMARAAVEAMGLTEETAFHYTHLASGRFTLLTDLPDIEMARKIAGETHELSEVSRLVSPWVQADQ